MLTNGTAHATGVDSNKETLGRICDSQCFVQCSSSFDRLSDDLLTNIFRHIPYRCAKNNVQYTCKRWYSLFKCPADRSEIWGTLSLRVSNRYCSESASATAVLAEVLDSNHQYAVSEPIVCIPSFLSWLTPRASGFSAVSVLIDVEVPWEHEVVACRRALWFVMSSVLLPALGLLSSNLKEVVITVVEQDAPPSSQHSALSANSALTCLGQMIGRLPCLNFLMIDCLPLQDACHTWFPVAVPALSVLIMRGCSLHVLPNLTAISCLRGIDLSCNTLSLSWLEQALPQLPVLDSLILCHCGLRQVPDAISTLTKLEKLYLNHNHFQRDWCPVGMSALTCLRTLSIQSCSMQVVPEVFFDMRKLSVLELQCNSIQALPEGVSRLTNLRTLKVSTNCLHSIPDVALGELHQLRALDLSRQATRVTTDGMVLDLCSTVRVRGPLTGLLHLRHLQVLRLPISELTDCEDHAGGVEDVEAVALTTLHINALRSGLTKAYILRGQTPPFVTME